MLPRSAMSNSPDGAFINPVMGGYLPKALGSAVAKTADFTDLDIAQFVAAKLTAVGKFGRARYMRPSATVNNCGNGNLRHVERLADNVLFDAVSDHLKKLGNLFFGQFSVVVGRPVISLLQACSVCMVNVLRLGHPLKVFSPVVVLVAVDMVCNVLWAGRRPRESLKDHPVDTDTGLPLARRGWRYSQVPPSGAKRLEDRASTNSSERANFVVSFVSGKSLPSFIILHGKYVVTPARNYNTCNA